MTMMIKDVLNYKIITSKNYNLIFNKQNGRTEIWGENRNDNPTFCPAGPIILDQELSVGKCVGCPECYKGNGKDQIAQSMSFKTYKSIFDKYPKSVCQIAFGITTIQNTPDLWEIMEYTRKNGVIPNITINGIDIKDTDIFHLSRFCGAVAVSYYNKTSCFDTIARLINKSKDKGATLKQVNIHSILNENSYEKNIELLKEVKTNPKLQGLNAVIFLLWKPKGNNIQNFQGIKSVDKITNLINLANKTGVQIGFDTCSAPMVLKSLEKLKLTKAIPSIEACESGLSSLYCDWEGNIFPCSFSSGSYDFPPINMLKINDFLSEVWYSPSLTKWRENLLQSSQKCNNCKLKKECRNCPVFSNITICKK